MVTPAQIPLANALVTVDARRAMVIADPVQTLRELGAVRRSSETELAGSVVNKAPRRGFVRALWERAFPKPLPAAFDAGTQTAIAAMHAAYAKADSLAAVSAGLVASGLLSTMKTNRVDDPVARPLLEDLRARWLDIPHDLRALHSRWDRIRSMLEGGALDIEALTALHPTEREALLPQLRTLLPTWERTCKAHQVRPFYALLATNMPAITDSDIGAPAGKKPDTVLLAASARLANVVGKAATNVTTYEEYVHDSSDSLEYFTPIKVTRTAPPNLTDASVLSAIADASAPQRTDAERVLIGIVAEKIMHDVRKHEAIGLAAIEALERLIAVGKAQPAPAQKRASALMDKVRTAQDIAALQSFMR